MAAPSPSPDSDQSISGDGANLSLMVPEATSTDESTGHWSAGTPNAYSLLSKLPHSPDADISSNSSAEDSANSSTNAAAQLQKMIKSTIGTEALALPASKPGAAASDSNPLPPPLTDKILEQALAELPMGAQLFSRTS
jgi:hypothetical protein